MRYTICFIHFFWIMRKEFWEIVGDAIGRPQSVMDILRLLVHRYKGKVEMAEMRAFGG